MTTAVLQYRVNGGAVTTGVTTVVAEDEIQLIAASYAGWGSPASLWEITAYPPGFPCPSGWSTNATTGRYYYLSNNTSLIPPVITMPASAAIASGQWGKFLFALTVLGGEAGLVDTSCGVKIASSAGAEDIAIGEEAQFDEKLRYVEAHQKNARLLNQAAAGAGSGVLLGSGTPIKVTAVPGGAGSLLTAAPFDHTHEVGAGSPVNIGTTNADGVGDNLARADHVHALPWATVATVFGGATTALPMNGQRITGLGTPSSTGDAATKLYVDGIVTFARVAAALATASSALDFNGQVLGDVDTPVDPTDAANKAYVDGVLGNAAPIARTITTTAPLTGGGDLSGDLTLAISAATTSAPGTMSSTDKAKLDGIVAANVQTFDADGTWTKPTGAAIVEVQLWGGGGGGGSGARDDGNTSGGAGGGGGGFSRRIFRATDLAGTVAITRGAPGAPGYHADTDDTAGTAGTAGGTTSFGSLLQATGGQGGQGGKLDSSSTGGAGGKGTIDGGAGASSTVGAGSSPTVAGGQCHGGASGGGVVGGAALAGGAGVAGHDTPGAGATAGASPGGAGADAADVLGAGFGGAGGASSVGGSGGIGGSGGKYGGGGAGGGSSTNGNEAGKGGGGGGGYALVITYFS